MELGAATQNLDGTFEDHSCRGAIDVVIAVDENALGRRNCTLNTRDRFAHALHQIWRMKMIQPGIEKASRSFSRFDSSRNQKTRHQRTDPRFPGDVMGEPFVDGFNKPAQERA